MQDMNQSVDAIASNLFRIRQSISEVARACTGSSDAIRLIAVSKGHNPSAIAAAIAAGQRDFGENTSQEAMKKIPRFPNQGLEWHFIGHLQTNKAKFIPGNFLWLHSLDNLDLARKLSRRAQESSANINILIEVNVVRDPRKHGIAPHALPDFIESYLQETLPALSLRGLMTIGPQNVAEKEIRECFAMLRELRDECRTRYALPGFSELSMGMSGDYVAAIKEGATMLRVGTAIFGERNYSR